MLGGAIKDPLSIVRAISQLDTRLKELGLSVNVSSNMNEYKRCRAETRDDLVTPLFDPDINAFEGEKAFWMSVHEEDGRTVLLQAYRLDYIDTNLSDWCMTWMLGLYHKRAEPIVPSYVKPPAGSHAERVRGNVVYFGELWIHADRSRDRFPELLPRYGMFLSLLKWKPDAIWSCTYERLATRGLTARMGFPIAERAIYRWEWEPSGADKTEWLMLAFRSDIEFCAQEMMGNK